LVSFSLTGTARMEGMVVVVEEAGVMADELMVRMLKKLTVCWM
jgi:hypothetical protein